MIGWTIAIGLYLLGAHSVYQGVTAVEEEDGYVTGHKWPYVIFWPLYELFDLITPEPK